MRFPEVYPEIERSCESRRVAELQQKRDQLSTRRGRHIGSGRGLSLTPRHPASERDSQRVPRNIQTGTNSNTVGTAGTRRNLLTGEGVGLDLNVEISSEVGGNCGSDFVGCNGLTRFICRSIAPISPGDGLRKSRRRGYASERMDCATGVSNDLSLRELQHQARHGFAGKSAPSLSSIRFWQVLLKAKSHGSLPVE